MGALGAGTTTLGAFCAFGLLVGTPTARADFEDLLADLIDPTAWGTVMSPDSWEGLNFDPPPATEAVPDGTTETPDADTGSVPLHLEGPGVGQPVVDVSLGGQSSIPVALDTGSRGLMVPIGDLSSEDVLHELEHFSFNDIDINAFPAGITVGLDVPTTVDFGNGISANTSVDGLLFTFPLSVIDAQNAFGANVDGLLGIGPNAGPGHLVTADLPGHLGDGVLIDEPDGKLVFGTEPDTVNGLSPITTLSGAPLPVDQGAPDNLQVQIGDGPMKDISAVFDTGGKGGQIPASVAGDNADYLFGGFGYIPAGVPISVYDQDGGLLYSYNTLGGTTVVPDWLTGLLSNSPDGFMNTGNGAFVDTPVYISNADGGSMTFYGPPH